MPRQYIDVATTTSIQALSISPVTNQTAAVFSNIAKCPNCPASVKIFANSWYSQRYGTFLATFSNFGQVCYILLWSIVSENRRPLLSHQCFREHWHRNLGFLYTDRSLTSFPKTRPLSVLIISFFGPLTVSCVHDGQYAPNRQVVYGEKCNFQAEGFVMSL